MEIQLKTRLKELLIIVCFGGVPALIDKASPISYIVLITGYSIYLAASGFFIKKNSTFDSFSFNNIILKNTLLFLLVAAFFATEYISVLRKQPLIAIAYWTFYLFSYILKIRIQKKESGATRRIEMKL